MMQCLSRTTKFETLQRFGDDKHRVYLEYRCDNLCDEGEDVCSACHNKESNYKFQYSRRFDHGKINEPIPYTSHIFGGEWYKNKVKIWGEPSNDVIEYALECQRIARGDMLFIEKTENIKDECGETYKEKTSDTVKIMPRIKKPVVTPNDNSEQTVKKEEVIEKKPRKPRAPKKISTEQKQDDSVPPPAPKKRGPAKKNVVAPPENILPKDPDNIVPTLIETSIEEYDTCDFDVVYVSVELFELNGTQYIREPTKNKLYNCLKNNKIGEYIGRYNPDSFDIDYEVPDSDSE
jgi:hypothetical protein